MPTTGVTPRLADRLCSLAESQLQMQTARSGALDTAAIGVMAVDTALIALVLTSDHTDLRALALSFFGLSLTLAIAVLALPGSERTGPSIPRMRSAGNAVDDHRLIDLLLSVFEHDVRMNMQALTRKATLFDTTLIFLVLGTVLEFAGRL